MIVKPKLDWKYILIFVLCCFFSGVIVQFSINVMNKYFDKHHRNTIEKHCISYIPKSTVVDVDEIITSNGTIYVIEVRPDSSEQILKYEVNKESYEKIYYNDLITCEE